MLVLTYLGARKARRHTCYSKRYRQQLVHLHFVDLRRILEDVSAEDMTHLRERVLVLLSSSANSLSHLQLVLMLQFNLPSRSTFRLVFQFVPDTYQDGVNG
jgi:hypothetical protein